MTKGFKLSAILLAAIIVSFFSSCQQSDFYKDDWKLGIQSYTFHRFSFQEAIDKTQQLGLDYIEVYYGQKLGDDIEGVMDFKMDKTTQEKILDYARSKGVSIIASGVVVPEDEEEWDQLFKFARDMGIKFITCEPKYEHLKYVDQLANEYNIDVAIHNHPKPSDYWNPDLFLKAVDGLSDRIGGCVDVGHWKRMGVDPLEGIQKYGNRVKLLHFKDIKEKEEGEEEQHDVIWGTGIIDMKGVLNELKKQKFKGLFSIEYEYNWDNSVPDIAENIKYFNHLVNELD